MTSGAPELHNPDARLPLWITELILWLSITMTHVLFYFFPWIIKKEWSMGGGASQPLNLFLFLESADLFPAKSTFI